jgi:hypothetical protein
MAASTRDCSVQWERSQRYAGRFYSLPLTQRHVAALGIRAATYGTALALPGSQRKMPMPSNRHQPHCPACGQYVIEQTSQQEIKGGPFSADPSKR